MDVETLVNKLNNIKKLDKEIQVVNLEIQYLETGIFKRSTLTPTKVQTSKTTDIADQYNSMIERKKELCSSFFKDKDLLSYFIKII